MDKKELAEEVAIQSLETDFKFDIWYAEAWSRVQGQFSFNLANNFIKYLKAHNKMVKSVLDVCSGAGEFISIMRNVCEDCTGIDNADSYIEYASSKHGDVKFQKVDSLCSFNLKRKFDVVSCNHDVVNMFTRWEDWQEFFNTVSAHINKGGVFMFDFYTQKKLNGLNQTTFEEGDGVDYLSNITQNNGLTVMKEYYYLKETSTLYRKTGDLMIEVAFETAKILDAVRDAGFRVVKTVDSSLADQKDTENLNRVHVIAIK